MEEIKDYTKYTQLMRNGFYDKLFFTDKLFGKWESLVDYGCADGFLTKLIADIFPDKSIIGYDENVSMIRKICREGNPDNLTFMAFPGVTVERAHVINLCSVLHEVYSYCDEEYISNFWKTVYSADRKYVVIRDMLNTPSDVWWSAADRNGKIAAIKDYCKRYNISGELDRHEHIYGPIAHPDSFRHFLMKYMYATSPNWSREVGENYLAVDRNEISKYMSRNDWEVEYWQSYCLPYLRNRWREDFGFNLNCPTHVQIILKRR